MAKKAAEEEAKQDVKVPEKNNKKRSTKVNALDAKKASVAKVKTNDLSSSDSEVQV